MTDAGSSENGGDTKTAARVRRGLDYALLGGLALLGLIAAIQFYLAADQTINVWVTREFRPPFKMVFNLVVLLVVGIGLSRQVRRLSGADGRSDGEDAESGESTTDATTDGGAASTDPGGRLGSASEAGDGDSDGRPGRDAFDGDSDSDRR
ncbi:hypothetical protein C2R22_15270 [Salinigranum rubrum]|uniref:DUF8060 domain-containing protein n=1 Tax=Salinigranum rubrum TaxID=755307 RepID=A0A2I8VLM0_9EURY|nr:hypothetical protein [Salinigranum rubrum]AUV82830.1 hypothetical protein C2R22_15270 [Salinigranum rubrum]